MTIWQALMLGVFQGITEFLPVSSSGHLVILQSLIGAHELSTLFMVVVHGATLVAIIAYFWADIRQLRPHHLFTLGVATVPAGMVGILAHDFFSYVITVPAVAGAGLMITGLCNIYIHKVLTTQYKNGAPDTSSKETHKAIVSSSITQSDSAIDALKLRWSQALAVGCIQAIALLPGVSRSGSTVAGGVWQKLDIHQAFRFSFLMAIPAIMGATGWELLQEVMTSPATSADSIVTLMVGAIVAGITGYLSLRLLKHVIDHNYFRFFAYYCWVVGTIVLVTTILL